MTEKVLKNSGYANHEVDMIHKYASCFYQKKITDENGIKYFIDAYGYNIKPTGLTFDYEIQFSKKGYYTNITMFCTDTMTIEEIENEIEYLWKNNSFDYYDKNN